MGDKVFLPFIDLKPINELEEITGLEPGWMLWSDGSEDLLKINVDTFNNLSKTAKPISPSEPTPTTIGLYKPTTSGTYANADDLIANDGYYTLFFFNGSNWSKSEDKFPQATQFIEEFKNSVFPLSGSVQRIHNNVIWELKTGETATAEDIPEVSEKWIKKINSDNRAIAVVGKNKVNPNYVVRGYYVNTNGHEFTPNAAWRITEPITVTGDMISNHSIVGSGVCNLVLDENREYLRRFDTQQYTYQSGDAFVVWSYQNAWTNFQIEEGNISTDFEAYTDKNDVLYRIKEIENIEPVSIDIYKANIITPLDNGGIKRDLGFDVPAASTGSSSYFQVKPFSTIIHGSYKVSVVLNHIGHNSFIVWTDHVNTSLGSGVTMFEKTFLDVNEIMNITIFPNNMVSGSNKYFRVSQILVTPLDVNSKNTLLSLTESDDSKIIDVSKSFDSTTNGWGITRFNNVITAWETDSTDYLNGRKDRKTIFRLMPGTYDEFETKWAGTDSEASPEYKGIIPRNNQYFESFDLNNPELTLLTWDGHAGFSSGHIMDVPNQVMSRCIFHISDWQEGGVKTHVKGFKISSKNTRYCVHPESAGNGKNNEWLIEDCVLDWQGRPNAEVTTGGIHVGIGISTEETGRINRVKCIGLPGGFSGHNNGWSINMGPKPFIVKGAKLSIENCDLGDGIIHMQCISNDANTPDSLIIEQCSNVDIASFELISPATYQNWKGTVINSDIINNEL